MSRKERLLARMKKGMNKGGGDFESTSIFKEGLDVTFWNPKEGQHWFDIVEYKAGNNDPDAAPGEETYVFQPYMHRNVGPNDRNVICLAKTYDKPCAICDHVKDLVREGADDDLIDELKVQTNPRAIYNVVVRDSKEEIKKGVQVFHTSHFIMEAPLLELANAPTSPGSEEVDPFTPFPSPDEDGKTIYFKRKGSGINTRFIGHNLQDRDYAISKKILEQAHTLDELVQVPTYEQQKAWLWGTDADETSDDDTTEIKPPKDKKDKKSEKKSPPPPVDDDDDDDDTDADAGGDEDSLEEKLKGMSRHKLKMYNKEHDLGVSIKPKMTEKQIVKAILEALEEKEDSDSEGGKDEEGSECPSGHVFGRDLDEHPDCEDCPTKVWKACSAKAEELEDEND